MTSKLFVSCFLFVFLVLTSNGTALASFVIQSQDAMDIELKGYNGLTDTILFKGSLNSGTQQTIDTSYRGLALLIFAKGQHYPLILGEQSFSLHIIDPDHLPSFTGSDENAYFYKLLTGAEPGAGQYDFALLMMQAKELLDSSYSIHTVAELKAMKDKFHAFVRTHYQDLRHSDMLRRLLGQYFMMHEYVDFHIKGAPASDIQVQYKKAVLQGVGNWLEIVKPHLPDHEILNYCVSLYYNRGMVTLASLIVDNFREVAYCPGVEKQAYGFPDDLLVAGGDGKGKRRLGAFKGEKIIAFVSQDCPVSMVETVIKVRQMADRKKNVVVIVAPLQELSEKHLAMGRMVSGGNMFFITDEQWRKEHLAEKIKLPLFVQAGDK
ncbi:MAG: hypothetical protein U9R57_02240 [Thermodesulfobacteriota bacterium]|nr:hypothetical protein [Thermodesulfobacteriota bacterium]